MRCWPAFSRARATSRRPWRIARRRCSEVEKERERFAFMAESMPQKIFAAGPAGESVYLNKQWMEFTGLSFEQLRDWGWAQFIHPDDLEESLRIWRQHR